MLDRGCPPESLKHRVANASATRSDSDSDSSSGGQQLQQSLAGAHTSFAPAQGSSAAAGHSWWQAEAGAVEKPLLHSPTCPSAQTCWETVCE